MQYLISSKIDEIENKEINQKLEKEKIDITLPERPFVQGKIHPVSQVIDELTCIFAEIGFLADLVIAAPEILIWVPRSP